MTDEGRLFLDACGATGPLRFEWADPATAEVKSREIEQAAFVVGRDSAADLVLDDPSVEPFHAYLHVVDGRLFAIDLESSEGLRWGEIPRGAGWVNRGQTLRMGRSMIRLVGGDREGADSIVEPVPTSSRYASRLTLPRVLLEFRLATAGKNAQWQRDVLERVLVLAGSSESCKLRVEGDHIARFGCALIRTPKGLWMSNIRPTEGATVNGAFCRFARIEDDDVVRIGHFNIRVRYNEGGKTPILTATYGHGHATANVFPAIQSRARGGSIIPSDASLPEILLQPLLEEAGSELGIPSSALGEALVLMVRLLGDVHRDQLALVRDELMEIRRLSHDMEKLRETMGQMVPGQLPSPRIDSTNGVSHLAGAGPEPEIEADRRPPPEAVAEIVSERIQAWERERQSRWRKLLRLLTQS